MPKIIKHRCNSKAEIIAARDEGYDGAEVDLVWDRTNVNSMIMQHNHGGIGEPISFIEILDLPKHFTLALNVKEYGMAYELKQLVTCKWFNCEYFIFDVPGAELEQYKNSGLTYFGRASEQELQLSNHGVLLDLEYTDIKKVEEARSEFSDFPIALISETLRGRKEWDLDALELVDYLITK